MDIVLLTIGYPYPKKDVFVANEIEYIAKKFDNVYIIPVIEGRVFPKKQYPKININIPNNVKICNIRYKYIDILKLNRNLIRENLKDYKFDFKNIFIRLRWYIHSDIVLKNINHLLKQKNGSSSNIILYSFWFHFNAMAISCLQEDFALKVSRAHGYDLYEERGIQPCKPFILDKLDAVFACSEMGKNYLMKKYNNSKCELSYLGTSNDNNVDIVDNRCEVFNIVSCSSVISIKRIDKIIDSLSKLQNYKIKWTHIGDGPLLKEIKVYSDKKLYNQENVIVKFLGNMQKNEVLDYYNLSNINLFINVSSTEGLPVSIMEAMSFGIPTIATDVGGVKEIVDNNKNGYLLDKEFEPEDLSKKIADIIEMDSSQYVKLCKEAFNKWNSLFNSNKNYNDYFDKLIFMSQNKAKNIGEYRKND